ncbi:MAG: outer membrane protein assembly factor, partial [Odoribacter sp.]|nr:outer membrane protein assembly factor [Odoribacter sp.]
MKKYISHKILLILCLASFFYACSPTRYVGKDEYLLHRVKVKNEEKNVSTPDLKKAIRQKPNTRILGIMRFHLGLYNLSGSDESKGFNRWLRSIGDAPVMY